MAVTNDYGWYILRDLPAGRIPILIACPDRSENTHALIDLGTGPATNRVLDIALNPAPKPSPSTAGTRRK
jgi:hypothetical protein